MNTFINIFNKYEWGWGLCWSEAQLILDDQATKSSLMIAIEASTYRRAKSMSSLSILVWTWLVAAGSSLDFPLLTDYNLELWSEMSPFSSKSILVREFITVMNETRTLPKNQLCSYFLVRLPWPTVESPHYLVRVQIVGNCIMFNGMILNFVKQSHVIFLILKTIFSSVLITLGPQSLCTECPGISAFLP